MATSYPDRLLEPLSDALTPEVASAIVDLRADGELLAHIEELRQKANEGKLTGAEDAEYKDFVEAVDVISIIQAKARRFLEKQISIEMERAAAYPLPVADRTHLDDFAVDEFRPIVLLKNADVRHSMIFPNRKA